jgi:DNA-binding winged helix-turn-helix (wHTH) protein/tetratricopeptide (TPR) repeat protein
MTGAANRGVIQATDSQANDRGANGGANGGASLGAGSRPQPQRSASRPVYAFGPFVLDKTEHRLRRADGTAVPLPGKARQILTLLVEAGGQLVPHEAFRASIWPDTVVEDRTLIMHMSTLRRALGADTPGGLIETVVGVGYRLTAPVRVLATGDPQLQGDAEPPARDVGRVAVRPFSTAGLPEADRYLGVALADALATTLGGWPGLTVTSAGTSDTTMRRAPQAGHVLEGSVELKGKRLQVTARLVDAASGRAEWSESFARSRGGGVAVQDAIARRVADALPRASSARYAPRSYRPRSTQAYFLQMQARANLKVPAPLPTMKALGLFDHALALDPDYALAHAGLASTYLQLTSTVLGRPLRLDEGMPLAMRSAERALALDDKLAEAWAVLGRIKAEYEWDWDGAEADLAHGVALNAGSIEALSLYGMFLSAMGQHGEAIATLERARALDPQRSQTLHNLGLVYWTADRIEQALDVLNHSLDLRSDGPALGHLLRMYIFDYLGRHDEAMVERWSWVTQHPHKDIYQARLDKVMRTEGARAATAQWAQMMENADSPEGAATQWLAVGEIDKALDCLDRCLLIRSTFLPFVGVAPSWRPHRGHPRYQRVLKILKLDGRVA